jgi:ATP-binding cassette, subfamily B, bacterial
MTSLDGNLLDRLTPAGAGARDLKRLPRITRGAVVIAWRAGPRPLLLTSAIQLMNGLVSAGQVLLAREFLVNVVSGDDASAMLSRILPILGIYAVLYAAVRYCGAVAYEQGNILAELVRNYAKGTIFEAVSRETALAFEEPQFYDRLQRATTSAGFRTLGMIQSLMTFISSIARILAVAVLIAFLAPILLIPLALAYVPLWLAVRRNGDDTFSSFVRMTPLERQRDYVSMLLTSRDPAKEIRAFDLLDVLKSKFDELAGKRVVELRRVARRRLRRQFLASLESLALMASTFGLLSWMYLERELSLPAVGAVIVALLQLNAALSSVGLGTGGLYEASLFLEDYSAFVDREAGTPAKLNATQLPPFTRLVADNVSFRYPHSSTFALQDVSLRVEPGKVIALVGENGSGKSTLAKIVAGLFKPTSGRVLWDGIDTSEYEPQVVQRHTTIVFQDYIRYHFSARENIGLGRHEYLSDSARVRKAAVMAGLDQIVSQLPDGFDTVLGKEFFGGEDLSAGQWQRVAIARAFFRDAPFVILDEPSAALDARAEQELFERVRDLFRGRAVLLISHRLASVRSADWIYVLHKGSIVEEGSHDELMAKAGLYAELFTIQADSYLGGPGTLTGAARFQGGA